MYYSLVIFLVNALVFEDPLVDCNQSIKAADMHRSRETAIALGACDWLILSTGTNRVITPPEKESRIGRPKYNSISESFTKRSQIIWIDES